MKVVVKRSKPETSEAEVLTVPVWQGTALPTASAAAQLDAHLEGLISEYLGTGDFPGTLNSTMLLRPRGGITAPRLLLVGLGKSDAFSVDHLRQASASAATTVRKLGASTMAIVPPPGELSAAVVGQAITEGALLGLYTLKKYKTVQEDGPPDNLQELQILANGSSTQQTLAKGVERGRILAEAVALARDLINSPGNEV
ncbi:MAG TPA: M17 family peptidase N-terminal domain-containing protein, partial [Candidatus Tectomicrobia bacterium]